MGPYFASLLDAVASELSIVSGTPEQRAALNVLAKNINVVQNLLGTGELPEQDSPWEISAHVTRHYANVIGAPQSELELARCRRQISAIACRMVSGPRPPRRLANGLLSYEISQPWTEILVRENPDPRPGSSTCNSELSRRPVAIALNTKSRPQVSQPRVGRAPRHVEVAQRRSGGLRR